MKRKQRREGGAEFRSGWIIEKIEAVLLPQRSYLGHALLWSAFIYFSLCSQLISTIDQKTLGQEACSHRAPPSLFVSPHHPYLPLVSTSPLLGLLDGVILPNSNGGSQRSLF